MSLRINIKPREAKCLAYCYRVERALTQKTNIKAWYIEGWVESRRCFVDWYNPQLILNAIIHRFIEDGLWKGDKFFKSKKASIWILDHGYLIYLVWLHVEEGIYILYSWAEAISND